MINISLLTILTFNSSNIGNDYMKLQPYLLTRGETIELIRIE